jgi:serine/threonine protein kinase
MDFGKFLRAFTAQRLTAPELITELDRVIADSPENYVLVRNQVEVFKRDVGLQQGVYDALCTRLNGVKTAGAGGGIMSEATVMATRLPGADKSTAEDRSDATVMAVQNRLDSPEATVVSPMAEATRIRELTARPPLDSSSVPTSDAVDPSLQEHLVPGMILKDRFVLEDVLGTGGMSMVFRARDLRKEEAQDRTPHVAIKVLGPEFKNHPESLKVLQREAKKAQTLAHPNIVNVYDFDRDGNTIFMTMEVLEGQGLDKLIRANKIGGLPLAEVLPIVDGIAQALGYAHKKDIVHSDLKPGNVYLTKDSTVKVLDFGIARARRDEEAGATDADNFDAGTLGALTPAYASSEMLEGLEPDPRDDIYALGCITYELLTGRHPFARKSAVEARDAHMQAAPVPGLKRRQWTALRDALAFKREERTADVLRFVNDLKPHRLPWKLIAAGSVIIAGSLGGWAYYGYQNKQLAQELGDDLARQAPVNLTPAQQAKIKEFLDVGKLYMTLGQYAAPPGDSAFDAYQKVLALDPRNKDARDAERKIADYYQDKGRAALEQGDLAQAKTMIELGLYVRPADDTLLALQKELKKR